MAKDKALIILCYATVYLVWGSTYFFIRAAVHSIAPELVVALRFLFGAAILAAIAWKNGALKKLPSPKEAAGSALVGIILLLLGNGLITLAEKWVLSYTISLIAACSPLFVALFNRFLYKQGISPIRFFGVVVGVCGIGVFLYDGTTLAGSLTPSVIIAFAGVLFFSFGTSAAKGIPKASDVFVSTAIQMLAAGGGALILALAANPESLEALPRATAWSAFSVAYLAVMGSLTLAAYNYLLVKEPSFRVSSYGLVNPLIAVVLGLAAGEQATPYLAFGVPLVLLGLYLMLYGDSAAKKLAPLFSRRRGDSAE